MRGGAQGKISVGDDFQSVESRTYDRAGACDNEPGNFHLGESRDFGEATKGECEDFGVGDEGFAWCGVEGEIQENFVDDECEIALFAKGVETGELFWLDVGTGWIVGMDEKNGAGAWRDRVFEGFEIDEPAVGVSERVRDEADVLEAGEKFEEGIARLGNEEFVAGIRE